MKKILFLSISRNGYTEEIIKEMEKKGYKVDYYTKSTKINKKELSKKERIFRTLYRDYNFSFLKNTINSIERTIYKKYIKELDKDYDFIFDLGAVSNPIFIEELKNINQTKKILFIWDDLKYHQETLDLLDKFDEVFTYNPQDAKEYNLKYRPSFYIDKFLLKDEIKDLDLYYVGSLRDYERTLMVKKINETLKDYIIDTRICCKNYFKYISRIGSYSNYKNFYRNNLATLDELLEKYKRSKVLLDISYKGQNGVGLRPIEAIATKSKVISTNEDIKKYDFYDENNIFVLNKDLSNLNGIKEFMKKPYKEYSEEIKYKYSLDGFLEDVFKN